MTRHQPTAMLAVLHACTLSAPCHRTFSLAACVREAAGAGELVGVASETLRLLFRKYVLQARWTLALHPRVALAAPAGPADAAGRWTAILDFLENLLDLLDANLAAAEADLLDACRGGLAHGTLLAVREVAEELPWAEGAALGHR